MMLHPDIDPPRQWPSPEAVRAYLLSTGWKVKPYPRPETMVFEGPDDDYGEPIIQTHPSSRHLADFVVRSRELLLNLSAIEDRPAGEILRDIEAYEPHRAQAASG